MNPLTSPIRTYCVLMACILTALTFSNARLLATNQQESIPWSDVGIAATATYEGKGLSISRTEQGAHLRCNAQKLEADATSKGLWLSSMASTEEQFRVVATALSRSSTEAQPIRISRDGKIAVTDRFVQFLREGVTEEYSVSVDGIRQDFVILERPQGAGELTVDLDLSGARAEQACEAVHLVLNGSQRTIAYSRLQVSDSSGRALVARMEVAANDRLKVVVDDATAIYPIRIDPTFSDANWTSLGSVRGVDGDVYGITFDASGSLYVCGSFKAAGSVLATNVAKWDGEQWSSLGWGDVNIPTKIAVLGSDVYLFGNFTNTGTIPAKYVAKWNGSQWSALPVELNGQVQSVAVVGTNLYVGGNFTSAGAQSLNHIARWDGSTWSALGLGINNVVYALAADGDVLYAGGGFTSAGGVLMTNLAKWDGTNWLSVAPLAPGSGAINALAISGTDIYANNSTTYINKWDGNSWTQLAGASANSMAFVGTNLYAARIAGGTGPDYLTRWNGSSWEDLGLGFVHDFSASRALVVNGTNLFIGGDSTTANGVAIRGISKWDGNQLSTFGPVDGLNGTVSAFLLATNGTDLYVGGNFTSAAGIPLNGIAKWNGSTWSALGSGVSGSVMAMAFSGTNLYVGGSFTNAGGIVATNIALWNGSTWSSVGATNGAASSIVYALAMLGNDLYAGGAFTNIDGVSASRIAKWNGTNWSALTSGLNNTVRALVVSGTDLYVGGDFVTAGGGSRPRIAKWNGSAWSSVGAVGLGNGGPAGVRSLINVNGLIYAGGGFLPNGSIVGPASFVARWNGTSWANLGTGIAGAVNCLTSCGTDVYACPFNRISRWNGSAWSQLGSTIVGTGVFALASSSDSLYVGGTFSAAGGKVSPNFAKADTSPSIGTQPLSTTNAPGDLVAFGVANVVGTPPLTYQWYQGTSGDTSSPITDATNTTYSSTTIPLGTNYFWVRVSNLVGTTDSTNAVAVIAWPLAQVTTQPISAIGGVGTPSLLTIEASSTTPVSYQWQLNGTNIVGATNATWLPTAGGQYRVAISNGGGTIYSDIATVTFVSLNMSSNQMATLTLDGAVGVQYRIDSIDNLGTNWTIGTNFVLPNSPYLYIDTNSVTVPQRFFRTILVP